MKTVFVSGCFDILHGGHVEFFRQARELGDRLIVAVPSDEVLFKHKKRNPYLPLEHKINLLEGLELVDQVVVGGDLDIGLNFKSLFLDIKPDILAVTDDDKYEDIKRALCNEVGAKYVKLPKSLEYDPTSTTDIYRRLHAPAEAPLRVDFAGGWLDVPRCARQGAYIVNCAISPLVSLHKWDYEQCGGLGGSGAYAMLMGLDGVESELQNGVGWQDPAVIRETGLCVWRSGPRPVLDAKFNPEFLRGKMALYWTGKPHITKDYVNIARDYAAIARAGALAREAAYASDLDKLCDAVSISYQVQLAEGMDKLPDLGQQAAKYAGGGYGGYAVYMFGDRPTQKDLVSIEPYSSV
jgi:cytidyltransferase-like protein